MKTFEFEVMEEIVALENKRDFLESLLGYTQTQLNLLWHDYQERDETVNALRSRLEKMERGLKTGSRCCVFCNRYQPFQPGHAPHCEAFTPNGEAK